MDEENKKFVEFIRNFDIKELEKAKNVMVGISMAAILELLIEKKIITQEEFTKKMQGNFKEGQEMRNFYKKLDGGC